MSAPRATLTPPEVACIRTALDTIDRIATGVQPLPASRREARIAEALDGVRYLLDRAEARSQVH